MKMKEHVFKKPISENQVDIEYKCMMYKVCRVKNSKLWITNYHDGMNILEFNAFKSVPFQLSETNEHFLSTHRLITDATFNRYMAKLENELKQSDVDIPDHLNMENDDVLENNDIIPHA